MARQIHENLPVRDLKRLVDFFTWLDVTVNSHQVRQCGTDDLIRQRLGLDS